jgi:ribosomal protein L11 methyltransferase
MEAGALGTEINQSIPDLQTATAYFESLPDRELVRAELADALKIYALPASSVREMNLREFADQDWLGEWKKSWTPVAAGKQFLIAPPWSEISDANDRIVIRIEPGMAFGTGTHETTRLCLSALEKYFDGGSLLDVGTGTGILAIAAAKLFPDARIEACDTDAEAVAIAVENARLNGVAKNILFRVGSASTGWCYLRKTNSLGNLRGATTSSCRCLAGSGDRFRSRNHSRWRVGRRGGIGEE